MSFLNGPTKLLEPDGSILNTGHNQDTGSDRKDQPASSNEAQETCNDQGSVHMSTVQLMLRGFHRFRHRRSLSCGYPSTRRTGCDNHNLSTAWVRDSDRNGLPGQWKFE